MEIRECDLWLPLGPLRFETQIKVRRCSYTLQGHHVFLSAISIPATYTHLPFGSSTMLCFLSSGLLHILFLLSKKTPFLPQHSMKFLSTDHISASTSLPLGGPWPPIHLPSEKIRLSLCKFSFFPVLCFFHSTQAVFNYIFGYCFPPH